MTDDIENILKQRGGTHGYWPLQAATSESIWRIMLSTDKPYSDSQSQALHMIATKLGRIICGNENEADHWRDLAGYATLVAKELEPKLNPEQDWSRANVSKAAEAQMRAAIQNDLYGPLKVPGLSEQAQADLDYLDRHGLPGTRRVVEPPSMAEMRAAADRKKGEAL